MIHVLGPMLLAGLCPFEGAKYSWQPHVVQVPGGATPQGYGFIKYVLCFYPNILCAPL